MSGVEKRYMGYADPWRCRALAGQADNVFTCVRGHPYTVPWDWEKRWTGRANATHMPSPWDQCCSASSADGQIATEAQIEPA